MLLKPLCFPWGAFLPVFIHAIKKKQFTHVGLFLIVHAPRKYLFKHVYFLTFEHAKDKKISQHAFSYMSQRKNALNMLIFLFIFMPQ